MSAETLIIDWKQRLRAIFQLVTAIWCIMLIGCGPGTPKKSAIEKHVANELKGHVLFYRDATTGETSKCLIEKVIQIEVFQVGDIEMSGNQGSISVDFNFACRAWNGDADTPQDCYEIKRWRRRLCIESSGTLGKLEKSSSCNPDFSKRSGRHADR